MTAATTLAIPGARPRRGRMVDAPGLAELLRVGEAFRLADVDPASTPGFTGGRTAAEKALVARGTSTNERGGRTTRRPTTSPCADARRRPGTWSRRIASGTPGGRSSKCSWTLTALDPQWPVPPFDVTTEKARLEASD